ncbi:MAG: DUF4194 domain-containing protein [Bacillales bacterium]
MFEEEITKIPHSDQKEFASVVNHLLLKGFIVRDIFDSKEKMMCINPNFRFIERYFPLFESYLKYSGWRVEKDIINGVIILSNEYENNRIKIDRETSLILFTLRLIFEEEKKEGSQINEAIYLTTPGLIKFMYEHGISMPGKKLTARQVSRSIRFLVNHNILNKVSGSYDDGSVSFYILPSIIYALDNEKIVAMSEAIDEINEKNNQDNNSLDLDLGV